MILIYFECESPFAMYNAVKEAKLNRLMILSRDRLDTPRLMKYLALSVIPKSFNRDIRVKLKPVHLIRAQGSPVIRMVSRLMG